MTIEERVAALEAKLTALLETLGVEIEVRPADPAAAAFARFRERARKQQASVARV